RLSAQPGIPAASTFVTRAEAEAAVSGAFNANAAQVSSWVNAGASGKLILMHACLAAVLVRPERMLFALRAPEEEPVH
ncbi:MAG: hypothetical protein JNN07_27680, partial [Verrucomicrobiales bacterium]|nr:hypothetical protein [Verrucomicrobiales bacterium]